MGKGEREVAMVTLERVASLAEGLEEVLREVLESECAVGVNPRCCGNGVWGGFDGPTCCGEPEDLHDRIARALVPFSPIVTDN